MSLRTAVAKRPWTVEVGAQFDKQLTVKTRASDGTETAVDLSSSTASLVVRKIRGSGPILLTLTQGAGITLGADGTVLLAIGSGTTAALKPGRYVFDLEIDDFRVVKGPFHVDA